MNRLQQLREALQRLDEALRAQGTCSQCGQPTGGIVPVGRTASDMGICTCSSSKVTSLADPHSDISQLATFVVESSSLTKADQ